MPLQLLNVKLNVLSCVDPDAAVAHVSSYLAAPATTMAAVATNHLSDREGDDEDLTLVRGGVFTF